MRRGEHVPGWCEARYPFDMDLGGYGVGGCTIVFLEGRVKDQSWTMD
jgi:hypothetical protein